MKKAAPPLLALAALVLIAAGARAQDPAVVNAKTIRVRFENDRVRVLEATLQPGEREAMHSHPAYVIHVLSDGKMRVHGADGKVVDSAVKAGDVLFREPVTHWAENVGDTPVSFFLVELKSPPAAAAP